MEEWLYEGVNASESTCGDAADASTAGDALIYSAVIDSPLRGEAAAVPRLLQQRDTTTQHMKDFVGNYYNFCGANINKQF